MRDAYQVQLDELAEGLATMCSQVADALAKATRALLERDLQLAEEVISEDIRIDDLRDAAEAKAFALLALQAPVATDLRIVVSAIHGAGDIERMGDLALHVAQAARRRHPNPVLPQEVAPYFAEMGRVGVALAHKAGDVIRSRDLAAAAELESDDDAMDDLHRHMFTVHDEPRLDARCRARRGRHAAGPVLRAVRRPRRRRGPPDRLRGDRSDARAVDGLTCAVHPAFIAGRSPPRCRFPRLAACPLRRWSRS